MAGPSGLQHRVLEDTNDDSDTSSSESDLELEEDSDSDTEISYNPQWSPATQGMRVIPFTKQNELLVPIPGENKPIDWFLLLCDDLFLENIVKESNKYAWTVFGKPDLLPKSRINKWYDLNPNELKVFIGLIFQMGTVRTNRVADYWKTSRTFNFPFIREQMSRDRFQAILRCIHFESKSTQDNKLAKVQLVIDHFNDKMAAVYYPSKELSIDEGMVLWRGRLSFRQYMKGKRHKYGIKIYSLCESNGLVLKFIIYSGKGGELSGVGHADKVVMHLMFRRLNVGHSIFMDNYYNSFPLASELLRKGTYCTGTLRKHRKYMPEDVTSAKLKTGEVIQRYSEGVMVAKWRDKREVMYLSTEFENTMAVSRNRRGVARDKPLPIIQYNAYMKGVDRSDQMMAYYPSDHKSLRWPTKIFVYALQLMMSNANKLHNFANPNNKISLYNFRLQVIEALLPSKEDPSLKRPRTTQHVLSKIPDKDSRNKIKQKRCRVCYQEGRVTKTVYMCYECPGQPGLCPVACFDKFHSA